MTPTAAVVAVGVMLSGCVKRAPPILFDRPPPVLEEPAPAPKVDQPDDCPSLEPLLPSRPLPERLGGGTTTCRGYLVPGPRLAELRTAEDHVLYWRDQALLCRDERLADQVFAQVQVDQVHADLEQTRRVARQRWWAIAGGVVVGGAVGAAVGFAAGQQAP